MVISIRIIRPRERQWLKAVELFESQHFQEAYDILQTLSQDKYAALIRFADDSRVMTRKAFCLLNLSRYEEAVAIYERLIKKIPDHKQNRDWLHQSYYFQGAALVELEQYERAIASLDAAIKYKSDNAHVWYLKACALDCLEQFQEAIECCDRALQYEPDKLVIYRLKAFLLYELGDYQNAAILCEYVLQNQPDNYLNWDLKAKISYAQEKYLEAIDCCDRALQCEPSCINSVIDSIYGKACCCVRLTDTKSALANLRRVMELAPQNYEAVLNRNEEYFHIKHDKHFQELLAKLY
ncbi:MAG: tetratricopeptide repeat protein [Cyanobacteria bacterium J06600_6]